eukprot:6232092-Amphidinium_carterae.1
MNSPFCRAVFWTLILRAQGGLESVMLATLRFLWRSYFVYGGRLRANDFFRVPRLRITMLNVATSPDWLVARIGSTFPFR